MISEIPKSDVSRATISALRFTRSIPAALSAIWLIYRGRSDSSNEVVGSALILAEPPFILRRGDQYHAYVHRYASMNSPTARCLHRGLARLLPNGPCLEDLSIDARGIDFHEAWIRVCDLAASGLAMGAAYVYAGAYTAPSYKQHTAIGGCDCRCHRWGQ